ncbi:hypothetical protein J6590_041649 [Homalodisca vitripennis]|nr:hypothetical protein J6590_041649 [Homalodisca vitripennis]
MEIDIVGKEGAESREYQVEQEKQEEKYLYNRWNMTFSSVSVLSSEDHDELMSFHRNPESSSCPTTQCPPPHSSCPDCTCLQVTSFSDNIRTDMYPASVSIN